MRPGPRFRRHARGLGYVAGNDVEHLLAGREQVIRDDASVATPPHRFRAHDRAAALAAEGHEAFEPRAEATENLWGYLWSKEAYGAMLFANALSGDAIADGLARAEHRDLYVAIAREILAVAAARGITPEAFDGFDPAAYLPDAPAGSAGRARAGPAAAT